MTPDRNNKTSAISQNTRARALEIPDNFPPGRRGCFIIIYKVTGAGVCTELSSLVKPFQQGTDAARGQGYVRVRRAIINIQGIAVRTHGIPAAAAAASGRKRSVSTPFSTTEILSEGTCHCRVKCSLNAGVTTTMRSACL